MSRSCESCGRRLVGRRRFCSEHKPASARPRKSTNDRDYGAGHQATRRLWAEIVPLGLTPCSVCGVRIDPFAPWDLDHTDDRLGYLGPAHRSCNRSKAAHKKNRLALKKAVARRWENL